MLGGQGSDGLFGGSGRDFQFGGMENTTGSSPTVINCIFNSNTSQRGGAVYNGGGAPTFVGCRFASNSAQIGAAVLRPKIATSGSPSVYTSRR